jgi:hypothetical protein
VNVYPKYDETKVLQSLHVPILVGPLKLKVPKLMLWVTSGITNCFKVEEANEKLV